MINQIKGQMSFLDMLNGFNNEEVSGEEISIQNEKKNFQYLMKSSRE